MNSRCLRGFPKIPDRGVIQDLWNLGGLDRMEDRGIKRLRAHGQVPFGCLRLSEARLDSHLEDLRIDTKVDLEGDDSHVS